MKIAILAPSPVPFRVGGAEKLWWGMLEYFNKETTHHCELIKGRSKEDSFWDLIESYHRFHTMDVSGFDLVISGKYPAWMVRHDNHHIYMLHCLRGLYDAYAGDKDTSFPGRSHPGIAAVLTAIENGDLSREALFDLLFALKSDRSVPGGAYAFPGPFIRRIIRFLDRKAMAGVRSFSAISRTVAERKGYFPRNARVAVIHPPSVLTGFENRPGQYFFAVSRLDHAKRMDLIVEAYGRTRTTIPLRIAGTGPLAAGLKEKAGQDPRIQFLGFVNDKALTRLYAGAYAVIFTPKEEDYGLVTIEAMMCGKPVITTDDSGGVLEFVDHGVTGLVCPPEAGALAGLVDGLADDPKSCRRMGRAARRAVAGITWEQSMTRLIEAAAGAPPPETPGRGVTQIRKLTLAATYPVYPPRGGGQNRIYYLCRELARFMAVEIVCLVPEGQPRFRREIAPGVREIWVPKTRAHQEQEMQMQDRAGIFVTDIAMATLSDLTPEYLETVLASASDADFLIACHPYVFPGLKDKVSIPVIHDSHNVEYLLKKQMLKKSDFNETLLARVFDAERAACTDAFLTTVCAGEDARTLAELYGLDPARALAVPNGVNSADIEFIPLSRRRALKQKLGLGSRKIVLFAGSWHLPNVAAVEEIMTMAAQTPDYTYLIMGGVVGHFKGLKAPLNVGFTGMVDDSAKTLLLSIADVAVNPMLSGSGTNLKMLDYMAAGIPVVSTPLGARGLDIPEGCIALCETDRFPEHISNIESYIDLENARKYVKEYFDWNVIARNLRLALTERLPCRDSTGRF